MAEHGAVEQAEEAEEAGDECARFLFARIGCVTGPSSLRIQDHMHGFSAITALDFADELAVPSEVRRRRRESCGE